MSSATSSSNNLLTTAGVISGIAIGNREGLLGFGGSHYSVAGVRVAIYLHMYVSRFVIEVCNRNSAVLVH
jgi:hypothetical protein